MTSKQRGLALTQGPGRQSPYLFPPEGQDGGWFRMVKMDNDGAIRVLLVGGTNAATQGISGTLSGCAGLEVVGKADSSIEAVVAARELSPDVVLVLVDGLASGMDGVDALRAITETRPCARVVIITRSIARYLVPAVKAGATGILSPEASLEELLPAICRTHQWTNCPPSPMQ